MLGSRFFFQWIIKYSNTGVFITSSLASLILLFRLYDAITDPICGYFSDRIKNKFTLINSSVPLYCIGLILCFYPKAHTNYKWFYELIGMTLFFTGYTLYCIPYWSLISDYAENKNTSKTSNNTTLSNLLGFGLLLATAVGFLISPILVQSFNFRNASIITALASFALMYLPNFSRGALRKKKDTQKKKAQGENNKKEKHKDNLNNNLPKIIFSNIMSALKNKEFLSASSIFVSSQMSLTIMTTAAPFIAIDLLGGKTTDVSKLLAPMIIIAIPSFILSQKLSKHWGWRKSIDRAALFLALMYFCTILVTPSLSSYMLIFGLSGIPIAILLGLEAQAVSEIGTAKISTYFGAINFLIKSANGLALFTTGILAQMSLSNAKFIMYMPLAASLFLVLGLVIRKASRPSV